MRKWMLAVTCVSALLTAGAAFAQTVAGTRWTPVATNVAIPQIGFLREAGGRGARVKAVDVSIAINEQAAVTVMDVTLANETGGRLEAEMVAPVPEGAVVRRFEFEGPAAEPTAQVLPIEESRRVYGEIVSKMRDPALLEFVGYNLIRSSIFPIEPRREQKVRLVYEQVLGADGTRVDYVLPRSEAAAGDAAWSISAEIKSSGGVSAVYSPTHSLRIDRVDAGQVKCRVAEAARREPGPFRMSYVVAREGLAATVFSYPSGDGGYFLLVAGVPSLPQDAGKHLRRDVTLVLDRSGSMGGEKIEQAKKAALQVVEGLEEGETFSIISYNDSVSRLSNGPLVKTAENVRSARAYVDALTAQGGTNLHDALLEALRQQPDRESLPVVLFLTDGLPTVGQTNEAAITAMAEKSNAHKKRVFTFGVGVDVNVPLLDAVASGSRGAPTYVLPHEDVEVKVGGVFRRLWGPMLASPEMRALEDGSPADGRITDVVPGTLPDVFDGEQLTAAGRYRGEAPVTFVIRGNYLGRTREFRFKCDFARGSTRNSFVPRLWASRRIGVLVDAVRRLGADGATGGLSATLEAKKKELVDEVVRLSKEFAILTEYTAFLAREGTDLANAREVLREAGSNFTTRAIQTRSGLGAVNQEANWWGYVNQEQLNHSNLRYDPDMKVVTETNVQQVADRAFYRRDGRWVDSRAVDRETVKPAREVSFGSEEFTRLADRLATEGRQGTIALRGDILLVVDEELVLVKNGTR